MAISVADAYNICDANGSITIIDKGEKLFDFDMTPLDLFKGEYCMLGTKTVLGKAIKSDCLIKKFPKGSKLLAANSLLKNVNHPNVVSIENFYHRKNSPRLVFSWVDGSLEAWTRTEGAGKVLKTSMRGNSPTSAYQQLVIDTCLAMEYLFTKKIHPTKIGPENIFMKKGTHKGLPTAKLLISEVIKVEESDVARKESQLWEELKQTAKSIFKSCATKMKDVDPVAERYFDSIGKLSAANLKRYPISWTEDDKAKYLFWVMSLDKVIVSTAVANEKLWPKRDGSEEILPPFSQMIEHDKRRPFPSNYNVTEPYDYLRICKNMIKHWRSLPAEVKALFTDVSAFVRKMDKFNPTMWCFLYEKFQV